MLPLVKNDPWLEPVVKQVDKRHDRYEERLRGIIARYGSLKTFATAHQFQLRQTPSRLVVPRVGTSGTLPLSDG